jgi:hypothetical protein
MYQQTYRPAGTLLLTALLTLAVAGCFLVPKATPDQTTTPFASEAGAEDVLNAGIATLEAQGFRVTELDRWHVRGTRPARVREGWITFSPTRVRTSSDFYRFVGSEGVFTLVDLQVYPDNYHSVGVLRVEKRGASLRTTDVRLSREIAGLIGEALAERSESE